MSDALVVTKPGGYRVASDEVFALEAHARRVGAHCERSVAAVSALLRRFDDHDLVAAHRSVMGSAEALSGLAASLARYSENVAAQERARTTWWEKPRDLAVWAVLMAAVGDSAAASTTGGWRAALADQPRVGWGGHRGAQPNSVMDDAAATLLHGITRYAPDVEVKQSVPNQQAQISRGVAERIARIPDSGSPVRIERYEFPDGSTHTEVFVAGTTDWGLAEGNNPFDMRSNLALVSGATAASVTATEKAMSRAGVKPGDPVVFVGHSQGGAVATTLANSGRYDTAGLIAVGAPTATLPVTARFPALVIEHRDDIVPALAGSRVPTQAIVVETDSTARLGDWAGAHSRERYIATATRIDHSADSDLSGFTGPFPRGARGTAWVFTATQRG